MIENPLAPQMRHIDPNFTRKLRETKLACKEAAGWRCEYIYSNGQRCKTREGQLRRRKGTHGRPDGWSVIHLHACHLDGDIENPTPRLVCLCPRHHMSFDRSTELDIQPGSVYRRGYQMTTTDTLLEEVNSAGIQVWEQPDGYYWRISTTDGTELSGKRTTAAGAVGTAIYHLCLQMEHLHKNAHDI